MTNPARELASLLAGWASVRGGESIYSVRGSQTQVEPSFIAEQVRACGLLGHIGDILDAFDAGGDDTAENYRVFLPRWWRAVVLPDDQWGAGNSHPRTYIDAETLASLRGFAAYVDKTELKTAPITADSLSASRAALDEVTDLLNNSIQMSEDTRRYLFTLITEIRTVFESDGANIDVDLFSRINELRGFLGTIADALENDENQDVAKTGRKLKIAYRRIAPVAKTVGATAMWGINMTVGTMAITQGIG